MHPPRAARFPSLRAARRSPRAARRGPRAARRGLRTAHHNLSRHTVQPSHTHPWTSARGNDHVVTLMLFPRHRCGGHGSLNRAANRTAEAAADDEALGSRWPGREFITAGSAAMDY